MEELRHPSNSNPYFIISSDPSATSWTAPTDHQVLDTKVQRSNSQLYQGYHCLTIDGEWNDTNSGGCYPNYSSWRKNEQYRLSLKNDSKECTCVVKLSWIPDSNSPPSSEKKKHVAFGLYVVVNNGPSRQLLYIEDDSILARSLFVERGDIEETFQMDPCSPSLQNALLNNASDCDVCPRHITIIPMTHMPNQTGRFRLSVHTGSDANLIKLTNREKWIERTLSDEWKGNTAGGRHELHSFNNNPKFRLVSVHRQVFQIFLQQVPTSAPAPHNMQLIGLYVIAANGDVVAKAPFVLKAEVFCEIEYDINCGPYSVVPCTYEPGKAAQFSIYICSPHTFNLVKEA